MATADSVKSKIQNLIASANSTTGQSDADMTSAVASLIAGFGASGSSVITGTYMTEERIITDIEFSIPGDISNFVMLMLDAPALDTGFAYCTAYIGSKDGLQIGAGSNNSGTASSAGCSYSIAATATGYFYRIVFGTDSVTLEAPSATEKYIRSPQAGKRYRWIAW